MQLKNNQKSATKNISCNKAQSPAQIRNNNTFKQLQIQKQVLKRLKQKNNISLSLSKKLKSSKKLEKNKKEQEEKSPAYTLCQCLNRMHQITMSANKQINSLIHEKEDLLQMSQRLRYYTENNKAIRQAYFVQQLQSKRMQEEYLQQKLRRQKDLHKNQLQKITKKLQSVKKRQAKYKEKSGRK